MIISGEIFILGNSRWQFSRIAGVKYPKSDENTLRPWSYLKNQDRNNDVVK